MDRSKISDRLAVLMPKAIEERIREIFLELEDAKQKLEDSNGKLRKVNGKLGAERYINQNFREVNQNLQETNQNLQETNQNLQKTIDGLQKYIDDLRDENETLTKEFNYEGQAAQMKLYKKALEIADLADKVVEHDEFGPFSELVSAGKTVRSVAEGASKYVGRTESEIEEIGGETAPEGHEDTA